MGQEGRDDAPSIGCVIPAKNEGDYILETLTSIKNQTMGVKPIIVVDDFSTDATAEIARDAGAVVIKSKEHRFEARTIRICETINTGLAKLPTGLDYVMVCGADDLLPPDWCESLIARMRDDPNLVICSGRVKGQRVTPELPRGIRIVDNDWWRREYNHPGIYHESYAWETLLVMHARWRGFRARQFADVITEARREVGINANWFERGKAMRQTGSNLIQVFWRSISLVLMDGELAGASELLVSYLESDIEPEKWARDFQRDLTIKSIIGRALGKRATD